MPQYPTEAECIANLGPKHVGYYQAGDQFVRLKASTFGRDWAVGKPNATVTKVVARREPGVEQAVAWAERHSCDNTTFAERGATGKSALVFGRDKSSASV